MPLARNYTRYGVGDLTSGMTFLYSSLDDFLHDAAREGTSTIRYGFASLDLHIVPRDSRNLVVMFHAAADPATSTLPIFVGRQLVADLDASVLFVSEPALDYEISIGWYIGDQDRPLQRDLQRVIAHVAESLGSTHLIFYGASAGGYASLYYSHEFAGSLSIAVNAQTNVERYYPTPVQRYYEACWSGTKPTPEQAVTNVVELYTHSFPNYAIYLQNQNDSFHFTNHFEPWKNAVEPLRGTRWGAIVDNWGDGHVAPDAFLQKVLLQYAVTFDGNWQALVAEEDFSH